MKPFIPFLLVLACVCVAWAAWPVQVQQAVAPTLVAYPWGSTPLHEVVVGELTTNTDRIEYIRAAVIRQHQLVELYETGVIELHGFTFTATSQTVTSIKQQFAALRTRVKAAEDAITAN